MSERRCTGCCYYSGVELCGAKQPDPGGKASCNRPKGHVGDHSQSHKRVTAFWSNQP